MGDTYLMVEIVFVREGNKDLLTAFWCDLYFWKTIIYRNIKTTYMKKIKLKLKLEIDT